MKYSVDCEHAALPDLRPTLNGMLPRSAVVAATLSIKLSLLVTAKRQQRAPLLFRLTLLLRGPSASQPLLYRRPLPDTT